MTSSPAQPLCTSSGELICSLLGDGYDVRLRVAGWSMKPLIRSGSVLRFTRTDDPLPGEVVLARHGNGALVAHRVVATDDRWIWTKGDACRTSDAPVSRESVVARAVAWEGPVRLPLGGRSMRLAGLVLNRVYPLLVTAYRRLIPRKKRLC